MNRLHSRQITGLAFAALGLILGTGLVVGQIVKTQPAAETPESPTTAVASISAAAVEFVDGLSDEEKDVTLYDYDAKERVGWHFIPMDSRKGLQVKLMDDTQKAAAFELLKRSLSEMGYKKATSIMGLESLLAELEKDVVGGNIRDPQRYYFTLFGDVRPESRWGLSVEGHHLSLNFVIDNDKMIASTPTFFATNPAEVKSPILDRPAGYRVLDEEESLAFELLRSLDEEQRNKAIFAEKALADVRAAGETHPPKSAPVGISYSELNDDQKQLFVELVKVYADAMPAAVSAKRLAEIDEAGGFAKLTFGWAGADRPGIGHYYRIQGPTMLIEFANTQPDSAGNPANHIHCMWRDPRGDFALERGE